MRCVFTYALAALASTTALASPVLAGNHGGSGSGSGHDGHEAHTVAASSDPALQIVLEHPRRHADRARDAYRNPAATLEFFQVQPGLTVVEYMPGAGWYTRILAPLLAGNGRYIALNSDVTRAPDGLKAYFGNTAATFPAKAAEWTGLPANSIAAYNTDTLPAELNGTVDRVLLVRALHNMWRNDMMHRELAAIRALLKEDGYVGVVQHRAKEDAPASYTDGHKGYMRESDVVALLEAHGFMAVGWSDINANPKDGADHDIGVWALPPALRKGDEGREAYKAIGESDRMTILFRKRP